MCKGEVAEPLRPHKLGQLPTSWGAFFRGRSPRESLPCQREVDAVGGRRDSDGLRLARRHTRGRAGIPPPRFARHLPLTREALLYYLTITTPPKKEEVNT